MGYALRTSRANARLDEIQRYIAIDNPAAAAREVLEIIERAEALKQFPLVGRVYQRNQSVEIREFVVGNYRIFYVVKPHLNVIDIITVWHGARAEPELP